ncbi:MAG: uracil-DNA glycosylase [Flavitalea sp.]
MDVQINESWKQELKSEFSKPYFAEIVNFLKLEKQSGKIIYPPGKLIFNAFDITPFNKVKVVILGQDPYHGPGQAHGLSFSVQDGVPPPPSLVNIYKEINSDLGAPITRRGNLTKWAEQGVLLLNATLTVRAGEANSHSKIGWHEFTNAVIKRISEDKEHVVFLLWGKFAQDKQTLIDANKHLILKSAHPSPLSAHNGFLGNKHFSQANDYLVRHALDPIDWSV